MPRYHYSRPNVKIDYIFRAKVYAHLSGHLELTVQHIDELIARGLTEEEIIAGGYKSLTGPYDTQKVVEKVVREVGHDKLIHVPGILEYPGGHFNLNVTEGLVIPVTDLNGYIRALQVRTGHKGAKYVTVTGGAGGNVGTPVHVPGRSVRSLLDGGPMLVTEGPIKAQVAAGRGFDGAVGLLGVSSSPRPLVALVERVRPSTVTLAFDMDRGQKSGVAQAAVKMANILVQSGQNVSLAGWDPAYNGIDDYLVAVPPDRRQIELEPYRMRGQQLRGGIG